MTEALQLVGGVDSRYKVKEVDGPLGRARNITAQWTLQMLEEFHEEGWRVCSVTPAGQGMWIFYERIVEP